MRQVAKKLANVVEINAAPFAIVRGHRVGRIVGTRAQILVVDYPGNPHGPLAPQRVRRRAGSLRRDPLARRQLRQGRLGSDPLMSGHDLDNLSSRFQEAMLWDIVGGNRV